MTLNEAKCGCKYCVTSLKGETCERLRMISLGLTPGREIVCCNNQWNGIVVNCTGCKLAMRKEEASNIEISPAEIP